MAELTYKPTNDVLFKMMFVRRPGLLKRLVADLLVLRPDSIEEFAITNPEMPPDVIGGKFCRLDINMTVDGTRVDLEIQVTDEGDFPARSLYYWARDYSTAIGESVNYSKLPRTIVVSILAFNLFDCVEFHSEFRLLEVTRHTRLTDRLEMHYFELPKLPADMTGASERLLWLKFFRATTGEELAELEALEVPIMTEAIAVYNEVSATGTFKQLERARHYAKHNEASALSYAWDKGMAAGMEKGMVKVVRNALADGLPPETVARLTGLGLDEIRRIAGEA